MATRVMVTWCLVLVSVWISIFGFFSKYFDGAEIEKAKVAKLQMEIRKSDRELAKSQLKFYEYKDVLASEGIKIQDNTKWTDPKRIIASVIADTEFKSELLPQASTSLFSTASKLFIADDYRRASELLEDLVNKYPDYPELAKAVFLLSECYFHLDQIEQSIFKIDFLVNHFPETEYSAYGLLRLANLFEKQDRPEEAVEIYETVIRNFKDSNASAMAKRLVAEASR